MGPICPRLCTPIWKWVAFWTADPNVRSQIDPIYEEFGDYDNRSIQILNVLDDTPQISSVHNLCANKHHLTQTPNDYEK